MTVIDETSTRAATYKVIINTLKGLPRTKLDAAWGLTGLVALYVIRYTCLKLERRFPHRGMSSRRPVLHHAYNLTSFLGHSSAHILLHQCISERLCDAYLDAGRLAVLPAQKSAWELSHQDFVDSSFWVQAGEAANHHSQTYFSIRTQASRRDDHSISRAHRHLEM